LELRSICQLIAASPNLRSFICEDMSGKESCFDALATHCPLLQALSFSVCDPECTASLVHVLQSCHQIEAINLDPGDSVDDQGIRDEHITDIMQHCGNLKAFFTPGKMLVSNLAPRMQNLRHIFLSDCRFESDTSVLALARKCDQLKSLQLWLPEENDTSQAALGTLVSNLKGIEELGFDYSHLSDPVLEAIAAHCTRLQRLHVFDCRGYTEEGVAVLAERCTQLQEVVVSEDDKVITPLGRRLWKTIRPGIKFALEDHAIPLWTALQDIERAEAVVW
jgi:hypothetical protein